MAVTTTQTNKPINPRGNDQSPLGYNRAQLFSGKALDFDGVNDKIDAGTLDITNYTAISVAGYINKDSTSTQVAIGIKHTGSDDIRFVVGGNIELGVDDGTYYNVSAPINNNEWYFAVLTFDGSTLKGYLNGVEFGSTSASFDFSTADGKVTIGQRDGGSLPYNGRFSNAKIFNTALTAAQVADLYNNPEKIVPTGVDDSALKLWLPMQEGAGTTAYDGSGNGNHGTISGATYTHGIGAPVAQTAVIDWNKGTNVVQHSQRFNQSGWTKVSIGSIDETATTAPDGTLTGNEVLFSGGGLSQIYGTNDSYNFTSGNTYTKSIYAKYVDQQWIQLVSSSTIFGSWYVNFDIQNGVKGDESGATATITDAGNGWYRLSVTKAAISSGTTAGKIGFSAVDSATSIRNSSLTATNKTAYFWGAQVEEAASVGAYVPVIDVNIITSPVLLPQGLTTGRDITGVNLFENVRKQGALNLDGNSWAEVHDNASLDITDAITLECWINSTDKDQYHHIISKNKSGNANYAIITEVTTGYLGFEMISGEFKKTDYNLMDGNWNHVVVTYDETNLKFYVNGALDDTIAYTSAIPTNDVDLHIGARPDGVQLYEADIAQPRIYNRALTAEEVQRNYNAGKNIYTND